MKYGVYVIKGNKLDCRMIAKYSENGYTGYELVATASTKAEAKEIFKSLIGNFWN